MSIDDCCAKCPQVAEEIKQRYGNFLGKPLLSTEFYLKGKEAELLLKICDGEEDTIIAANLEQLKESLLLETANDTHDPNPPVATKSVESSPAIFPAQQNTTPKAPGSEATSQRAIAQNSNEILSGISASHLVFEKNLSTIRGENYSLEGCELQYTDWAQL